MSHPDTHAPVKVLLVDDDEDDAVITQALLEQSSDSSFEIEWVCSYEAGLTSLKEHRHDIGLLDYNLGSRSGIDFLQEVQADQDHAPIIMLTGQGNETLVLQALHSGAIDYLPKRNISSENLQLAICHAIEKKHLQAELTAYQRQLEQTNRELQQRNDEIQRFYDLVVNELKTPLATASEFVNLLLEGRSGPLSAAQTDYAHLIHGCCAHLNRNINDLHEVARLKTERMSLDLDSEGLPNVIFDALHALNPQAQAKGILLQASLAPDLPNVMMDVQRVRLILLHLVGNALKYTEPTGTILVTAEEDVLCPGRIRIAIADTGVGIAQDQLAGIFERLYQVEKDPSGISRGLGLGLFVSRELVKRHHGTMSVTSTLGKGSTFSFTLPCA